ncbi:MAG: tetratricopeptide repeat protein [Calditrichota bacterium]
MKRNGKIKKSQSSKPINDVPRLKEALQNVDGFALHILVCDSAAIRKKLLKDLKKTTSLNTVDFKGVKDMVQHLISGVFFSKEKEITVISQLEKFFSKDDQCFVPFNERFDEIRGAQRSMLLIISASMLQPFIRQAPLAWNNRSGFYLLEDFLVDRYRTGMFLVDHFSNSGEYTSYDDKQNLLRIYQHLWKEYQAIESKEQILYQYDLTGRLARLLYRLGSYKRSASCLQQQMKLARTLGNDKLFPEILNNLGWVNLARGDFEDALENLLSAKEIGDTVFRGDSHPSKAAVMANLGEVYFALGSYKEAFVNTRQAMRMAEYKLGTRSVHLVPLLKKLARSYAGKGQYEDGLDCHRRALQIVERKLGLDHPYIAAILQQIGMIYFEQQKFELAQRYVFRNMETIERTLGAEHPYVGLQLANIGLTSLQGGDENRALQYLFWAIEVREKLLGTEDPLIGTIYMQLAQIYINRNAVSDARACLYHAVQIYQMKLPAGHPDLKHAQAELEELESTMADNSHVDL